MKIVVNSGQGGDLSNVTESQILRIQTVSENNEVILAKTREEHLEHSADADVILGIFNREIFECAKKLQWVQTFGAGVDTVLFEEFVASPASLTSAKGTVGTHLADHAWALLLGLLRGIGRAVRERTWGNALSIRSETWELGDRTLGIVGLGGTGIEVARRAVGFGMDAIAIDPEDIGPIEFVKEIWKPARFHDLLERSDVVVVCAPLTKETRGMFNADAFQHMKRHAILINVTRGPIIDHASLLQALENGLIGAVGLDVTEEEPLPSDSPLWDMKNVIITPHTAGGSPLRMDRTIDLFCENLRRMDDARPLLAQIDKSKGY
ncbi:D-2-hydroxyacid dehydrogenase [SAR202 cluster bacterium AD-802-E10_MRT_200m]|nr:D-2-hydroxyacid dehydrogenase [SAR202 cluster bacterium AD-802-E10_MRT_200m]